MDSSNFLRNDNIGASIDGAPAVNVYSKFIYQNVEYSLPVGVAFCFCRGVGCSNKTRIGVTNSNSSSSVSQRADYYNERLFLYQNGWSETTYTAPDSSVYALSPANAELQAALGSDTVFDMEWVG